MLPRRLRLRVGWEAEVPDAWSCASPSSSSSDSPLCLLPSICVGGKDDDDRVASRGPVPAREARLETEGVGLWGCTAGVGVWADSVVLWDTERSGASGRSEADEI